MRIGDGTGRTTSFPDIKPEASSLDAARASRSVDRAEQRKAHGAEAAAGGHAESTAGASPFARILHGLGSEVDKGEKMVRKATSSGGQDLGPSELLALQAGVYRYSEAVDLSAKLIDRATSGVKTVIQGQ
jgi:hypothetical protein